MRSLLVLGILLWPATVWASDGAGSGLLAAGLKMMGALVVVLGIVLLLYAWARKKPGIFPATKTGAIKVVETRYLGPKKSLCLVAVRGEEFLLGVGQEKIELLSRLGRHASEKFEDTLQSNLEQKQ